mgnify:CR=1 FL=1
MNKKIALVVLYAIAFFFTYTILRYVFFYYFEFYINAPDKFVGIRVFLSGPFLILIGIILIAGFKSRIHKLSGYAFGFIGLIWIIWIVKTLLDKP